MIDVRELRAHERAKRLVVLGAFVLFYAGGWLLVAWHASRIAETECTIVRDGYGKCSVTHEAVDEEVGLLPVDDCDDPTRIPSRGGAPLRIGAKVPCFYYVSAPDRIVFTPRHHDWWTPGRLAFAGVGVAIVALGLMVRVLGRRRRPRAEQPAARADPVDPYREPEWVPPPSKPAPSRPAEPPLPRLAFPLAGRGNWCGWVVIGPIFVLSSITALVGFYVVAWDRGGDFDAGDLSFTCLTHPFVLGSAAGLFYRSELVLDGERGVVWSAWGMLRPWFRSYEPLAALTGASVHESTAGRGRSFYLRLHYEGERTRDYAMHSKAAGEAAAQIQDYLRRLRSDQGSNVIRT